MFIRTNIPGLEIPEYFRVPSIEPGLEILLVDDLPRVQHDSDTRMVGLGAYDTGPDEITYECDVPFMYLLGARERWTSRVRGLHEDKARIETKIPFFRAPPVRAKTTQLLARMTRMIISVRLGRKGHFPCFATAVSQGEDATLLIGYSWSGKSTVAANLVQAGFSYLSDDFAILDPSGTVLCYPDWHQPRTGPSGPQLLRYFRQRPMDFRSPRVREPPIQERARVRHVVFLERGRDAVEELDGDEALRRLRLINLEETMKNWSSPMSQMLSPYAYLHPELALWTGVGMYDAVLKAVVDGAETRRVIRSRSPRFEAASTFLTGRAAPAARSSPGRLDG